MHKCQGRFWSPLYFYKYFKITQIALLKSLLASGKDPFWVPRLLLLLILYVNTLVIPWLPSQLFISLHLSLLSLLGIPLFSPGLESRHVQLVEQSSICILLY